MSSLSLAVPTVQDRQLTLFTGATIRLVDAAVAGKSAGTQATYTKMFKAWAEFTGHCDPEQAVQALIRLQPGQANAAVLAFKAEAIERGLSPSSVNLRLSAVKVVVKCARRFGLISWSLDVDGLKSETYRDTRGPGAAAVGQVVRELGADTRVKALRDRAMIALAYDLALRRAEVCSLNLDNLDINGASVSILGKGRREREIRTLPPETVAALKAWLEVRGSDPGPLFYNLDRAGKGKDRRLTGGGFWSVCRGRGLGRPHGLRHSAITEALVLTNGSVSRVQKFSRHADVKVLQRYDDAREDIAGMIAKQLAAGR
jgi:integrase/recombinase XerC